MAKKKSGGELFNLEDLEARSRQYLEEVRKQARGILENAVKEAEAEKTRILEEAREEGVRKGYDAGLKKGLEISAEELAGRIQAGVEHQLTSATEALTHVTDALQQTRDEWRSHWEKNAMHLLCMIAECVIRRKMRDDPDIQLRWIQEALELSAGGQISLHMNPADLASLGPTLQQLASRIQNLGTLELLADETLTAGDCKLETCFGKIDMRVETQMRRVMEELM